MFKGTLEAVTPEAVSGWMWCEVASLRDCAVLAFVEAQCVGSGKIGEFRADLYEAGLGDGQCGFSFPITLSAGMDCSQVYVKMESSDFCLLQDLGSSSSRVQDASPWTKQSLQWMSKRGWLRQEDISFLRGIMDAGAVVLSHGRNASMEEAAQWATEKLALWNRKSGRVERNRLRRHELDRWLLENHDMKSSCSVVGLVPQAAYRRSIVEGSHRLAKCDQQPGVVYRASRGEALFLDVRCDTSETVDTLFCEIELVQMYC